MVISPNSKLGKARLRSAEWNHAPFCPENRDYLFEKLVEEK